MSNIKRFTVILCLSALTNVVIAETFISNSVPNLTTRTVFTVPAGQEFQLTSVIIATNGTTSTCCQRIFRNGSPQTGFISVQGQSTIQIVFDPAIVFQAGQTVQVRNGASSGPTSWTLNGEF